MAKLLLEAGANVFTKDRWGNSPIDEGRTCGNKNMIRLLEEAKTAQITEYPDSSGHEVTEQTYTHAKKRKCTVFPFHPWDPKEGRRHGIVMWVPGTMEEVKEAASNKQELAE